MNTIAGELSIVHATGARVAFSCTEEDGNRIIDLSGLPNGLYLLMLKESGTTSFLRIVVQR